MTSQRPAPRHPLFRPSPDGRSRPSALARLRAAEHHLAVRDPRLQAYAVRRRVGVADSGRVVREGPPGARPPRVGLRLPALVHVDRPRKQPHRRGQHADGEDEGRPDRRAAAHAAASTRTAPATPEPRLASQPCTTWVSRGPCALTKCSRLAPVTATKAAPPVRQPATTAVLGRHRLRHRPRARTKSGPVMAMGRPGGDRRSLGPLPAATAGAWAPGLLAKLGDFPDTEGRHGPLGRRLGRCLAVEWSSDRPSRCSSLSPPAVAPAVGPPP